MYALKKMDAEFLGQTGWVDYVSRTLCLLSAPGCCARIHTEDCRSNISVHLLSQTQHRIKLVIPTKHMDSTSRILDEGWLLGQGDGVTCKVFRQGGGVVYRALGRIWELAEY